MHHHPRGDPQQGSPHPHLRAERTVRLILTGALLALAALGAAAESVSLDEYLRLRQSARAAADAATRAGLERRAGAARETLLAAAGRRSQLLVVAERRRDYEASPEIQVARLVARDGRVTLEALQGPRPQSPDWERAGEVEPDAYLAVLRRLLDDSTFLAEWPAQRFDPNAPGPRRAVTLRLAIGDEERELVALSGTPYERLRAVAAALLEFCRLVPLRPSPPEGERGGG